MAERQKKKDSEKRKSCNEDSIYTRDRGTHCDGWHNISLKECKKKCINNEKPATCPQTRKNCSYEIWDNNPDWGPGWCQLADSSCEYESSNTFHEETRQIDGKPQEKSKSKGIRASGMFSFYNSSTSAFDKFFKNF